MGSWWSKWARRPKVWGYTPQELTLTFDQENLRSLIKAPTVRQVVLRPAVGADHLNVERVRRADHEWLKEWEATVPPEASSAVPTWEEYPRLMDRRHLEGEGLAMIIEVDGQIAGLVSLGAVERGAMQSGILGYWIIEDWAGLGIASLAVAATIDLVLGKLGVHRVEVNVRPENAPSLGLARKLGLREEGYKRRFMHIAGRWADHIGFAVDQQDLARRSLVEERIRY